MSGIGLRPLHDRVVIEVLDALEKSAGGIIIPDSAKEKPQKGKIVAAGLGVANADGKVLPLTVKVGDVVLFAKWGGTEIKVGGKDYLILKESDILAIEA